MGNAIAIRETDNEPPPQTNKVMANYVDPSRVEFITRKLAENKDPFSIHPSENKTKSCFETISSLEL